MSRKEIENIASAIARRLENLSGHSSAPYNEIEALASAVARRLDLRKVNVSSASLTNNRLFASYVSARLASRVSVRLASAVSKSLDERLTVKLASAVMRKLDNEQIDLVASLISRKIASKRTPKGQQSSDLPAQDMSLS
jgi:hypothetical protein